MSRTAAGANSPHETTGFIPCSLKLLARDRFAAAAATTLEANLERRPVPFDAAEGAAVAVGSDLAAMTADRKWHRSGVRLSVSFLDDPPRQLWTEILVHMNAWGETANVCFTRTYGTGQVRIARAGDGHWSYLGTDILQVPDDEPTMNLHGFTVRTPEADLRRVVRHETGHTLGFPHERLSGPFVRRLVESKVIDYYAATQGWSAEQTRAEILTPRARDCHDSSDPLRQSIMGYELPGALTIDGWFIRGGDDISCDDARHAAACYPKPPPA